MTKKVSVLSCAKFSAYSFGSLFALAALTSCSGGGGESGDGRTRETAVRVIHASIDTTPLDLSGPEGFLQTARFNEVTRYVPLKEGAATLVLSRARSPQVVAATFNETLKKDTEYTVFVFGEAANALRKEIIEDTVTEPESGQGLVRFMNGYSSNTRMQLRIDGAEFSPQLQLGGYSDFIALGAGEHNYEVRNSSGSAVASGKVTVNEGAELTVVFSGSAELKVSFVALYHDRD